MSLGDGFSFISGGTGGGGGGITIPVSVAQGGTGSTNTNDARAALGAAASGADTSITSIALTSGTIADAPQNSTDIANKGYVDTIAGGLNWHQSCKYATTIDFAALSMAYFNGSSGINATLTKTAPFSTLSIDSNTPLPTQRILVKNASNSAWNGVYTVTTVGSSLTAWQMTRATDYDTVGGGTNEIDEGDYILVTQGSTNANTSWVQQTPLPIVIGTTPIVFIQFAALPTYPISILNGGTGATDASGARTNLGLTIGTDVLAPTGSAALLTSFPALNQNTTGTASNITGIAAIANGGTGAANNTDARTNLGLTIGTDVLAPNGSAASLTSFPTLNQNTTGTSSNVTGVVAVANGGTNATTAADARTNLGLVIGTNVLAPTGSAASLTSFPTLNQNTTGTSSNVTGVVAVANGGTNATTAADARTNLGLVIGTNVLAPTGSAAALTDFPTLNQNTTGLADNVTGIVDIANGGTNADNITDARTNLGLVIGTDVLAPNGSASALTSFPTLNQNTTGTASNVTGTVAVINGGTGAINAADARTNLGLVIGTNVLAPTGSAASLTSFPTLNQNTTGTAANVTETVAVINGGTGAINTTDARTNLGLGTDATGSNLSSLTNTTTARSNIGLVIGTDVLAPTGSAASLTNFPTLNQNTTGTSSNVTGTVALLNGGTGAIDASGARTNLGLIIGTNVLAPTGSAASLTSFPTLNQNTTGTASNVTGTVAVANGGTGITTVPSNGFLPIGNGTNYTAAALTQGAGITITNASGAITVANAGTLATAGGLSAVTPIAATVTYTSGGVTLTSQTMASGSVWRVRAFGTYITPSSGTARNAQMACFWGATQLTGFAIAAQITTVRTTNFNLEFIITGTSTTAAWVVGTCGNTFAAATYNNNSITPTSNTSLPTGAQTLDLKFSMSNATAADAWSIQSVIMERIK